MIDFRYHLVSLVSVFIALAVGILLGAGPLQKPLEQGVSQTFQQQVESLRQDRQQLRDQLDSAQAGVEHRDDLIADVTPALVRDALTDRSVVLVTLPDAATDRVGALTKQVEAAGGTVTGRVTLRTAWTDPAKSQDRADLATSLVSALPGGAPVVTGNDTDSPESVLAGLLARALVAPSSGAAGTPDPAAKAILEGLRDAGMVTWNGAVERRAGLAVLLAPGVEAATATGTASATAAAATSSASPSPTSTAARPWNTLALALDTASEGAVVLGPGSSATNGGVVADVRGDGDLEGRVSTVDTGGTAMGDLTTVLALAEQVAGRSGRYGFGAGATAPLPPTAQTASSTPSASPSSTSPPGTATGTP